jgi:hypothetical protein
MGKLVGRKQRTFFGIHYQKMASEGSEVLACAVVRSKVHELVKELTFSVITIYKLSINLITNPNSVSTH